MAKLHNKIAVITGGGSGIGFEIAKKYVSEGCFVVICGRTLNKLNEAVKNIPDAEGKLLAVKADISHETEIKEMVNKAIEWKGRIDILVNNAGAMRINKPLEDTSLEEWNKVILTNISGNFLVSREVGKVMIKHNYGRIVNIGSMSGLIANKYFHAGSYEVSKAAYQMLTKVFAVEWCKYNIRVNCIAPGYYSTEPNKRFFIENQELNNKIMDLIPLNKLGNLNELASLSAFLASDEIDYLTGVTIVVDGGYTLW